MPAKIMRRASAFSFSCGRCSRCCRQQAIQINPYEIWRLARSLGLAASQFIDRHTSNGGLFLRFGQDGACDFLGETGCMVHAQRPLACRLYPLGRSLENGHETFERLEPHPDCQGRRGSRGSRGSVASFLEEQEALPYLEAAERYAGAINKLLAAIEAEAARQPALSALIRRELLQKTGAGTDPRSPWVDWDAALAQAGLDETCPPRDPREALELYLTALEKWIDDHIAGNG